MIEFDPSKNRRNIRERRLDFADAAELFRGDFEEFEDDREDYGETRMVATGHIGARLCVCTYTWRGPNRRIISLRLATKDEQNDFYQDR